MKKRALTLIEIMIVIFLITLITGAIGYNMKGAMDKGKRFKTIQARDHLRDLLLICLDEGNLTPEQIAASPENPLITSGLAKNPKNLLVDGWGEPFTITAVPGERDFKVTSKHMPDL